MAENQIITELLDAFKGKGYVKTAKELGILMGENANGFSDIQAGRKKLTLEHVINLKNSHPDFNVEWIVTRQGAVFIEEKGTAATNTDQPAIRVKGLDPLKRLLDLELEVQELLHWKGSVEDRLKEIGKKEPAKKPATVK